MADAPFCRPCWDEGKIGQTYRLAGQPNFRCHDCHSIYHQTLFEPWELDYRKNLGVWVDRMKDKVKTEGGREVFEAHAKRLEGLAS